MADRSLLAERWEVFKTFEDLHEELRYIKRRWDDKRNDIGMSILIVGLYDTKHNYDIYRTLHTSIYTSSTCDRIECDILILDDDPVYEIRRTVRCLKDYTYPCLSIENISSLRSIQQKEALTFLLPWLDENLKSDRDNPIFTVIQEGSYEDVPDEFLLKNRITKILYLMEKTYKVSIEYYYNMPDMKHNREVVVEASCELDAKDKVKKKYPNITKIEVEEQFN